MNSLCYLELRTLRIDIDEKTTHFISYIIFGSFVCAKVLGIIQSEIMFINHIQRWIRFKIFLPCIIPWMIGNIITFWMQLCGKSAKNIWFNLTMFNNNYTPEKWLNIPSRNTVKMNNVNCMRFLYLREIPLQKMQIILDLILHYLKFWANGYEHKSKATLDHMLGYFCIYNHALRFTALITSTGR